MTSASPLRRSARRGIRMVAYIVIAAIGGACRLVSLLRRQGRPGTEAPREILVIRLDLLGDVLLTMPAVEALRETFPDANIRMMTLPYTAPLARLFPFIDEVIEVDSNRIRSLGGLLSTNTWRAYGQSLQSVRSLRPDLCISVSGRMASLCAFLSGAHRRVGYSAEAYPFLLTHPVRGGRYSQPVHEVDYCLRLAGVAGARLRDRRLSLPVPPEGQRGIDVLLQRAGIGASTQYVAIHPGSVNGTAKRWTVDGWGELAARIFKASGLPTVLVGAGSDRLIADRVVELSGGAAISLAGETTIPELVALLNRAALVATGDSGPLHLSVALERPLLCVYGPTDPRVYGPYKPSGPVVLLRKDLPCSPCYSAVAVADCPLGDPICMRLIGASEMLRSALQLLGASDPKPA